MAKMTSQEAGEGEPEFMPPAIDQVEATFTQVPAELQVPENTFVKEAMEKLPEVVLPHVLAAAEQNQPLEAVYERRHEVKDEANQPMDSIGTVISKNYPIEPQTTDVDISQDILPIPQIDAKKQMVKRYKSLTYHQAIRLGLQVGIGIIGLVTLFLVAANLKH